jgi:putative ABC transport system permease protein
MNVSVLSLLRLCSTLAFRNNLRNRRRTAFAAVVTAFGIVACSVLWGFVGSSLELTENAFTRWGARGHLIIESPLADGSQEDDAKKLLSSAEQRSIREILAADPRVDTAMAVLELSGLIAGPDASMVFVGIGVEADRIRRIKGAEYEYDVVAGSPLWASDPIESLILGQELARTLGCRVPDAGFRPLKRGERPTERSFTCPGGAFVLSSATAGGQIAAVPLRPTGIMDWGIREVNQRLVVLPMRQAQTLLGADVASKYHVKLTDGSLMEPVKRSLEEQFRVGNLQLRVFRWSDRALFYQQVRGLLLGFLTFIISVAVLVALGSLANTASMNVMSRIREFATLRSFGFSRGFTIALCAVESMQLGMVAAVAGLVVSMAVIWSVNAAELSWIPPGSSNAVPITLQWSFAACAVTMAIAVVVSGLAAIVPARAIVRRSIRAALSDMAR